MDSGKTQPSLLTILDSNNVEIEVIAKMSSRCDLKEGSLVAEALTSLLAVDLGLPIPRSYLVDLSAAFIDSIVNPEVQKLARTSSSVCFGSRRLQQGAHAWVAGTPLPAAMLEVAAGIFALDALIDNVDRRSENTNLLTTGEDVWVYDHELAFPPYLIGVKPPWIPDSREDMKRPGLHVLYEPLRGRQITLATFAANWGSISNARLDEYSATIPPEWSAGLAVRDRAITRIKDVRDNIEACISEVIRVLK